MSKKTYGQSCLSGARNANISGSFCHAPIFPLKQFPLWVIIFLSFFLFPSHAGAELAEYFAEPPDTGVSSNTVIDIIEHNGGIWFATGEGVNFSLDSGQTWLIYNSSNGLVSDNVSAIFSMNNRLWVATNHGYGREAYSDGVSYTDDNGYNWTQIDFSPDGLDIPYIYGGFRTIYDITGYHDEKRGFDWLFFTAFAGGFLASQDNGMSWRRIFATPSDSTNFIWFYRDELPGLELRLTNRYFSCATDTSHTDSLFVWAGTAGGLYQYVYAAPWVKPSVKHITAIAFFDTTYMPDSPLVFYGGDGGVMRGKLTGGPFITRFESDGLPGPYVSAICDFGGKVFVGTVAGDTVTSTGLAVSTDRGDSFTPMSSFTEVTGVGRVISDFVAVRGRLYLAAQEAGLFVSSDTGANWQHIFVDSGDTSSQNRRNVVYALDAVADTLLVGTDSGLVILYMDTLGNIDSSWFHVFPETEYSSTRVVRLRTQYFYDSTGAALDSTAIWTINQPVSSSGTPAIFRSYLFGGNLYFTAGKQIGKIINDINFIGDSVFVVSDSGIYFTELFVDNLEHDFPNPYHVWSGADNLNDDKITTMEVRDSLVFFGTTNGFAISTDRGESYRIFRVNTDTLAADFVLNHSYLQTLGGISGNFIPALAVQYIDGDYARIWVSGRPASEVGQSNGISVGQYVARGASEIKDSLAWKVGYPNGFAWNFAFNGDTVFAATDVGLLMNYQDVGETWDTVALTDTLGNELVLPGTPVYAVEVSGNSLWVGTGDRTLRLDLNSMYTDLVLAVVDSTNEVYAFPVPFSHTRDLGVDFHFFVEKEAYITIEIYDFAMNLVARVVDNQLFPPGFYPESGPMRTTWDGRNERGEQVAVGVYYFKVSYSTGEVRWGKLAVIP